METQLKSGHYVAVFWAAKNCSGGQMNSSELDDDVDEFDNSNSVEGWVYIYKTE